jgi:hypothetical protein
MPRADLVSTFSFAMNDDYRMGTTACTDGLYAGCMTAPCFLEDGDESPPADGDAVRCECPTYTGPYQVGQVRQDCSIPSDDEATYVWSAAYSVSSGDEQ